MYYDSLHFLIFNLHTIKRPIIKKFKKINLIAFINAIP